MRRHELTDAQWELIAPLIAHRGRSSKLGDRCFVNAVIFLLKTGTPWRDLPERFGNWKTVFNRFANWSRKGQWKAIFEALQLKVDKKGSLVDATIVRAHLDAAGGKGGSWPTTWVIHVVDSPPRSTPS
jgi:transposase